MSSLVFDSLRFARRLKEAGVPDNQAEVQAELMAEAFGFYVDDLVTRDYLDARQAEFEARIDVRFTELEGRFKARLEARFAQQDLYIEQRLSSLETKLNVMAAVLAVIAASVVPLAISNLLAV